jgi:hypothetical protein
LRWKTALLCALLPPLGACKSHHAAALEDAAPSLLPAVAVLPTGVPSAAGPGPSRAEQAGVAIGCRAIAVDGEVRVSLAGAMGPAIPLATREEIPNDAWLVLAAKARVVAKDPRTTRETTFFGPARVQACVAYREESWIAQGTFESAPGAGEAPGAEEWVATPHGVLRYVAAKLRARVVPRETTVSLGGGAAFFWAADDVQTVRSDSPDAGARPDIAPNDEPWQRLSEGTLRVVMGTTSTPADAARLSVEACSLVAERSEDLARALLSGERAGASDLGRTIADQITARRIARASCAVAGLRIGALSAPDTRTALSRMLERANARWSNLPQTR